MKIFTINHPKGCHILHWLAVTVTAIKNFNHSSNQLCNDDPPTFAQLIQLIPFNSCFSAHHLRGHRPGSNGKIFWFFPKFPPLPRASEQNLENPSLLSCLFFLHRATTTDLSLLFPSERLGQGLLSLNLNEKQIPRTCLELLVTTCSLSLGLCLIRSSHWPKFWDSCSVVRLFRPSYGQYKTCKCSMRLT